MTTPTIQKALYTARQTRTGAMIRAAAGVVAEGPTFHGKASVTSDGFLICDFSEASGERHGGALAGSWNDLHANLATLCEFLDFDAAQRKELMDLMNSWIAFDYRNPKRPLA